MEFSNHADSEKYNLLSKCNNVHGQIYQKKLFPLKIQADGQGSCPCYLAVPMGHLCLVYTFPKMIALEELGLTQQSHLQSFVSRGLIFLLSQCTHLTF